MYVNINRLELVFLTKTSVGKPICKFLSFLICRFSVFPSCSRTSPPQHDHEIHMLSRSVIVRHEFVCVSQIFKNAMNIIEFYQMFIPCCTTLLLL